MSFNLPSLREGQRRVVIVGGGFAGLKVAGSLAGRGIQVVLVDRNNYHQFPPLIYQIASAGLEPSSIAFPFRKLFQGKRDVYFRKAEVRHIFHDKKLIQTSIGKLPYDYLVLAAGATTNYFGNAAIAEESIPMKTLSEAMGLRNALLDNFERAVTCSTEQERQELLNIVIVGGGATGVEIAGAIAEMKRHIIPKDYPELDVNHLNIILLEASDRLLSAMHTDNSAKVREYLEGLGVEVRTGAFVTGYEEHQVRLRDGTSIPTRTFIWVSGITANQIAGVEGDFLGRGARIKVDAYNRVVGLDGVFAIGDQCLMEGADPAYPQGHPQVAQVAIQQGVLLAKNISRLVVGEQLVAFRYKDLGSMATVGRNKAVAELPRGVRFRGWLAWVVWLVVHLRSILGVRNKLAVLLNWIWNYFSYGQSLRLIIYAQKAKEVRNREALLASTHWGHDLREEGLEHIDAGHSS